MPYIIVKWTHWVTWSLAMTEITTPDFLDIFIGRQNIENICLDDVGNICFDLSRPCPNGQAEKTPISHRIRRGDFEDITEFFSNTLHTRPFAKHLLQILWIREVKFAMGALKEEHIYDFIQGAFTLYGVDIDDETLEYEFFELLYEGYIRETNAGFLLSSEGIRVADAMFQTMKMPVSVRVEPATSDTIEKLLAAREKRSLTASDIERAVYAGSLRASVDSKHPDDKYRRWAKWKNGVGFMEIAKSEHPDWEQEYGEEVAKQKYDTLSSRIRMQVTRLEKRLSDANKES